MAGLSARPHGVAAAAPRVTLIANRIPSQAKQGTAKRPAKNRQKTWQIVGKAPGAERGFKVTETLLWAINRNGAAPRCRGPEAEYGRQDRSQAIPSQRVLQMVIGQGDHELSGLR